MANGKGKGRRKSSKKLPVAILAPVALPAVDGLVAMAGGDFKGGFNNMVWKYTGVASDGKFNLGRVVETYTPVVGGIIVHKIAGKYVNRYLPSWLPLSL